MQKVNSEKPKRFLNTDGYDFPEDRQKSYTDGYNGVMPADVYYNKVQQIQDDLLKHREFC